MPINQLKVRLIKIDGINILFSKGMLDMDKSLIEEKQGRIFKEKTTYKIKTKHMKRTKKGKALMFIDVKEGKSFDPETTEKPNIKCQNCLQYLLQKKNWESRQVMKKISKWNALFIFLAGIGFFFLITQVIGMIVK